MIIKPGKKSFWISGTSFLGGSLRSLPSGAIAIWDAANFVSTPRKVIKNSITNGANDSNLLSLPRRLFNGSAGFGSPWSASGLTVVDANQTAPDGSGDASQISNASAATWSVTTPTPNLPAGTYTLAISVKSLAGSLGFILANDTAGTDSGTLTATTSWQRFTYTFTTTGGNTTLRMKNPVAGGNQINLAIIDFELFAGSSDLHASPLSTAPLAIQNADWVLGKTHYDTGLGVSGGFVLDTSTGFAQFLANINPAAFTILWSSKQTSAGDSPTNFRGVLGALDNDWSNFAATLINASANFGAPGGQYYNQNSITKNTNGQPAVGGNSWGQIGSGVRYMATRYDGTTSSMFINGVKAFDIAISKTVPTVLDFTIGQMRNIAAGESIGLLAIYTRALTDVEVRTAYSALSRFGVASKRNIGVTGDSISANNGMWTGIIGPNLSPQRFLFSQAVPGETVPGATTGEAPSLDQMISASPPQDEWVLVVELGTNDLKLNGFTAAQTITNLANFIDARKAAGWQKVVCHTILPRSDAGGTMTEAQFNTARATVNTSIRGWVGSRINAVADWAADATMGPDGASTNVTNYQSDFVHPTFAGSTILEAITRAALNSI